MSAKHPIISITGSSGAGTSTVKETFEKIFRREGVTAAYIEGDAFHRYDREAMKQAVIDHEKQGDRHFSHFGADANLLVELEEVFRTYAETGTGQTRHYIHNEAEALALGRPTGTFTDWKPFPENTDLLFYEGLHGAAKVDGTQVDSTQTGTTQAVSAEADSTQIGNTQANSAAAGDRTAASDGPAGVGVVDLARHADLKIGVVPVTNLEWIQKLHRDSSSRGHSTEAVTNTILRRMPDYVNHICPQFSETDINFQRVPLVDTSNPFIARWIPTLDESVVVIRFRQPRGIDFSYLRTMIDGSFMSRANSIVIPGGKTDLAMQLILTPLIHRLVEKRGLAA